MTVSDHAVLRYLERFHGFGCDWMHARASESLGRRVYTERQTVIGLHQGGWIDRAAIEAVILTRAVRAACLMGEGRVMSDRIVVCIRDGRVTTVMTRAMSAASDRRQTEEKQPVKRRRAYRDGRHHVVPA